MDSLNDFAFHIYDISRLLITLGTVVAENNKKKKSEKMSNDFSFKYDEKIGKRKAKIGKGREKYLKLWHISRKIMMNAFEVTRLRWSVSDEKFYELC